MAVIYCSKCGKPLTDKANFCVYCGSKLRKAPVKQPTEETLVAVAPVAEEVKAAVAPIVEETPAVVAPVVEEMPTVEESIVEEVQETPIVEEPTVEEVQEEPIVEEAEAPITEETAETPVAEEEPVAAEETAPAVVGMPEEFIEERIETKLDTKPVAEVAPKWRKQDETVNKVFSRLMILDLILLVIYVAGAYCYSRFALGDGSLFGALGVMVDWIKYYFLTILFKMLITTMQRMVTFICKRKQESEAKRLGVDTVVEFLRESQTNYTATGLDIAKVAAVAYPVAVPKERVRRIIRGIVKAIFEVPMAVMSIICAVLMIVDFSYSGFNPYYFLMELMSTIGMFVPFYLVSGLIVSILNTAEKRQDARAMKWAKGLVDYTAQTK